MSRWGDTSLDVTFDGRVGERAVFTCTITYVGVRLGTLETMPAPAEIRAAIKRAGIAISDIDYINAHGTSTQIGDEIELGAVERLLGNAASTVSMSSTKSSTGHLLGAAGAIEAIFSILAIRDNVAPPTINLENPSVETAIDLVPQTARKREINVALSNSFGFGGTNASVIVQRVAD